MADIQFSKEEKAVLVERIQHYFKDELKQPIGGFDAEFLLDFFTREVGPYFYNRAVQDAQAVLAARIDEVQDTLAQLERPTGFRR